VHLNAEQSNFLNNLIEALRADAYNRVERVNLLGHYTSFESFEKILESKSLQIRLARKMPDLNEIIRGTAVADRVLREEGSELLRHASINIDYCAEKFAQLRSQVDRDAFIFSLTEYVEGEDDINFWERYSDEARGVCLVFHRSKILEPNLGGKFPIKWLYVIYGHVDAFATEFRNGLRLIDNVCQMHSAAMPIPNMALEAGVASLLAVLSPACKGAYYRSEREIRFLHIPAFERARILPHGAGIYNREVKGEQQNCFVLPLRDYPDLGINIEPGVVLDHLVVGPRGNIDKVRTLLRLHGLEHLRVIQSDCSLRAK
jgi:hypothetical protein